MSDELMQELDAVMNASKPQAGQGGAQATIPTDLEQQINAIPTSQPPAIPGIDAPLFSAEDEQYIAGKRNRPGYLSAFAGGAERNLTQIKQVAPTLKGIYSEATGDQQGAQEAFQQAQAMEEGQSKQLIPNFTYIKDWDDFGTWLSERTGEQAFTMLSLAATGGTAALAANLTGRGLMMSAASRAALTKYAALSGGALAGTALETAGTGQELKEATGSYHPALSVGAGAVKGALEIYTPAMLIRGLSQPGKVIGTEIVKHAAREGLTETAQETIDAAARAYTDPNYNFFSKENAVRITEAGLSGFAVGGVYGGAGEIAGRKHQNNKESQKPGEEKTLTPEEIKKFELNKQAEEEASQPTLEMSGPLGWLRKKFLYNSQKNEDRLFEDDNPDSRDPLTVAMTVADLKRDAYYKKIDAEHQSKIDDLLDDTTARYTLIREDGKSDGRLYTGTDIETARALLPQGEKLEAVKIDMQRLAPGHITAEVRDLPLDANNKRIYVLPGTSQKEETALREEYAKVIPLIAEAQRDYLLPGGFQKAESFLKVYNELLKAGLRVIPERNQSFHYSGQLTGKKIDINNITSWRSVQQVYSDGIENGLIKAGKLITARTDSIKSNLAPIVLDLEKIDRKNILGVPKLNEINAHGPLDIDRPTNLSFEEAKAKLKEVANRPGEGQAKLAAYQKLYNETGVRSVYIGVNDLALLNDVSIRDATFGNWHYPNDGQVRQARRDAIKPNTPQVTLKRGALYDTNRTILQQKENAKLIQQVLPFINKITDGLGMPRITVVVEGTAPLSPSPAVNVDTHTIHIPLSDSTILREMGFKPYTKASMLALLLHEVGHTFTMFNWAKLPAGIQEQILRGHKLAQISHRITGVNTRAGAPVVSFDNFKAQGGYWATQSEYFAEQFRRWATERLSAKYKDDVFFKDIADGLKVLAESYKDQIWPELQKNFTQTDRTFHVWMDYFEELRNNDPVNVKGLFVTRAKMNVRQLNMPKLDENRKTPEFKATIALVKKTMTKLQHLVPKDWTAKIEPAGNLQALGEASTENKLIRMFVNALNRDGSKLSVPLTFIHETVHAVWDRFNEYEKDLLISEAKKWRIDINETFYRNYYEEALKNAGWDITEPASQAYIESWLDEERVCALFEAYTHNKIFDSNVKTVFDAVKVLMNEVTELANGQFKTVDDLIRSFFRGEIAAREESATNIKDVDTAKFNVKEKALLESFEPKTIFQREHYIAEVQREDKINAARGIKALAGEEIGQTVTDYDRITAQTTKNEQARAAKLLNIPFDQAAPTQQENTHIYNIFGQTFRGENNATVDRHLTGQTNRIGAQIDRITWFSKLFFGLHQLAWRNQHIPQMRDYVTLTEQWNTARMRWISSADTIARKWDKLRVSERDAMADVLFWLTEMRYRTRQEIAARVVRLPTQQELMRAFQSRRLGTNAVQLYQDITKIFSDYLTEVERVSTANISRTITDPAMQQRALAELAADMAQMRAKPYFPMTRFGEWTITVRDPGNNNQVVWFSAYATSRERDAAVPQVAARHQAHAIQIGRLTEEAHEFMGLPAPLLKQIKNNLPGISQQQMDWIDQLTHMNSPEQSFRKRWLQRSGTPGYSLDALRAFAQYFVKGGNYIARIEYNKPLSDQVESLRRTLPSMRDTYKRGLMVEYMQKHHRYIMEGGQDWSKAKALFALWQLGFSPVAAGMNLTQNMQISWPYFTSVFGNLAGTGTMLKMTANLKRSMTFNVAGQSQAFIAAREELISQGKIDVGQAPELGNFAEGSRLSRLQGGTEVQRAIRTFQWASMVMFQYTERFNRELTFRTAWELANAHPNNVEVQRIATQRINEVFEIAARRNLSHQQAAAVLFAREAIDRTQFVYSPMSRPQFLRNGPLSAFMVFFNYTQSMLYAMRYNPGAAKIWLTTLALYGVSGLPGADDLNELIKLAARRGFGINFNPQKEMRKFVRDITRGTAFDQVGPDLAMHGISRYGFGWGLLPEGWGVPRFDASANGSMSKVVPGLAELAQSLSTTTAQDSWKDVTAGMAKNAAGAGFGQMFAWLKFMQAPPGSDQWKLWESIMPRAAKGVSKAWRFTSKGQETTTTGAKFVGFDVRDPDDRATIITQALGLNPQKLTSKWEAVLSLADDIKFYQSRRLSLLAQMDDAVQSKDQKVIQSVVEGIKNYNQEMLKLDLGAMGLDGDTIRQSLTMKARNRQSMELDIPQMRKTIPMVQKNLDLFPAVPSPMRVK